MFAHVCSCLFMFAHFCSLHICSEKSANISKHIKATKSPFLANTVKAQMSDVVEADSAMLYVLSFIVFTSRGKVITVNALLQQSVIRDNCWGADVKGNLIIMFQNFPSTILSDAAQSVTHRCMAQPAGTMPAGGNDDSEAGIKAPGSAGCLPRCS